MSSAQIFTDDVFISYRHLDNELQDEQGKGWIDNFHDRFESVLGETLGYEPAIWRDPRLPGNAYFADVLEARIRSTAVLISILSPGYLQSDWCIGELREFCHLAESNGGLLVGERMRIFKVVKTHVERSQHPPEFQKQLGYEFYEIDKMTQRPAAFGQGLGKTATKDTGANSTIWHGTSNKYSRSSTRAKKFRVRVLSSLVLREPYISPKQPRT